MNAIDRFKQMPPCPAETLVSHLGELLPRIAGSQERHKVTEIPTPRTLRFYVSQGLLDKPVGYDGRVALFGYRHLIQVLVIKVLQADDLPLRKIRDMLRGLSTEDLEKFLSCPREESAALLAKGTGPRPSRFRELLKTKLAHFPLSDQLDQVVCQQPRTDLVLLPARPMSWRRLEVEPGVELHLREDVDLQPGSRLDVLLAKIKHLLNQQNLNSHETGQ